MGLDITGIGSIFDFGGKIIDKIFPDKDAADKAKLELFKLQQAGDLQEMTLEYQGMAKQIALNMEEAKHPSLFVSGWRPAVGWTCVVGLGYSFLIQPILVSCKVDAPTADTGVLMQLLFALLGVAGMRTWEKLKKVARKQ